MLMFPSILNQIEKKLHSIKYCSKIIHIFQGELPPRYFGEGQTVLQYSRVFT